MTGAMTSRFLWSLLTKQGVVVAILLALSGCGEDRREVRRLPSPDSRGDALIVDASGGATEPYVFEIYVVPKGAPLPKTDDVAVRMVGLSTPNALKVEWRRAGLLTIRYDHAWVQRYTNRSAVIDDKGGRYLVEVRLMAPIGDDSALPTRYRF